MNRGIFVGLFAVCLLSLSAIVATPRVASALSAKCDCDAQLEQCVSNAIDSYDSCVCNLDPNSNALRCTATLAPSAYGAGSPSSIKECVETLQGDLFKCSLRNGFCHLACDGSSGGGMQLQK